MFEINPGLIVWTIVTFVAALVILRAAAWNPLLAALAAREDRIRTQIAEADRARREAERLLDENRAQLARADEQSQRMLREGRDMGERLKAEILEKAQHSSRQMVEQAKEEIRREKESALQELRAEVADLAIGAAGKLLDANLDTPKHRAMVDDAIRRMETNA
jgi:F-type H+-transporting ATPase subunit b